MTNVCDWVKVKTIQQLLSGLTLVKIMFQDWTLARQETVFSKASVNNSSFKDGKQLKG